MTGSGQSRQEANGIALTMKDRQGADRFSMRGLERCRGEWQLDAAVHNLRKLHRESAKNTKNYGEIEENRPIIA